MVLMFLFLLPTRWRTLLYEKYMKNFSQLCSLEVLIEQLLFQVSGKTWTFETAMLLTFSPTKEFEN